MKYDSSSFVNGEAQGGASVRRGTRSASSEVSKALGDKKAIARNWAWARQSESYDWMDTYGPFSSADLDD